MKKKEQKNLIKFIVSIVILLTLATLEYYGKDIVENEEQQFGNSKVVQQLSFDLESIPEFDGSTSYIIINDNIPDFEEKYYTTESFENYSELDILGRCRTSICKCFKRHNANREKGRYR